MIHLRSMAVLFALLAVGCGSRNVYVEPPPPEVIVTTPIQRTVTEYLEFSGMTQPMETIDIRARVKGFLKERHFVEGADVKQGQLLLVIDEEPFRIQLDAAMSRLKEAEASLEQAKVSKTREVARSQVKLSETQVHLAQREEKRIRNLSQKKIATESEMEQAEATLETREAELESAKANLDQVVATYDTTILSCQAQVESAAIAVRNSQLDVTYCRMTAPMDGRISRVNFDIGNLVGDGQSSILATIVRVDPVYAYATISESDLTRTPMLTQFRESASGKMTVPVELGMASQEGYPYRGTLDYSDPSLDAATGTLRIRGTIPNAERSLLPGMFVRMRIPIKERIDAVLVPERALGTDQSGQFLLVVGKEGKVEYRPVRTSMFVDNFRVVEGQLASTDQIIVEGLLRARAGAKVTPVQSENPSTIAVKPGVGDER